MQEEHIERDHHGKILQKIHDHVWQLIEEYGEAPIRRRIAAIDAQSLNTRSRAVFDPPMREFLRKYFDGTIENVSKFHQWRAYLYTSVLGFPADPVVIKDWPEEIPQSQAA